MNSVIVTEPAAAAIAKRYHDFSAAAPPGKSIPVLLWSVRSYFDDHQGNRTTFGSRFYFHWTNESEIKEYNYLTINVVGVGELALAPGELFRTGSHTIEAQDGTLVLVS
jgi:hypothetical protein